MPPLIVAVAFAVLTVATMDRMVCPESPGPILMPVNVDRLRPGVHRERGGVGDRVERGRLVDRRDRDGEGLGHRVDVHGFAAGVAPLSITVTEITAVPLALGTTV